MYLTYKILYLISKMIYFTEQEIRPQYANYIVLVIDPSWGKTGFPSGEAEIQHGGTD